MYVLLRRIIKTNDFWKLQNKSVTVPIFPSSFAWTLIDTFRGFYKKKNFLSEATSSVCFMSCDTIVHTQNSNKTIEYKVYKKAGWKSGHVLIYLKLLVNFIPSSVIVSTICTQFQPLNRFNLKIITLLTETVYFEESNPCWSFLRLKLEPRTSVE